MVTASWSIWRWERGLGKGLAGYIVAVVSPSSTHGGWRGIVGIGWMGLRDLWVYLVYCCQFFGPSLT